MDKKTAVHKIEHNTERTIRTLTFLIFAVLCGLLIGATGVLFHECIDIVTELRMEHPRILLLLPFGAVLILFLYRRTGNGAEGGTNLIISSIQSGETVPLRMAPLIFIATTIFLGPGPEDPGHDRHVRRLFSHVRYAACGGCISHGSGQRGHHALFRTSSLHDRFLCRLRCLC